MHPSELIFYDRVSPAFAREVIAISERLGIQADWLMAAMHFESAGTFDPSITNGDEVHWRDDGSYEIERQPGSSAIGLIQFMDFTAEMLGTTCGELRRMTALEQLGKVEAYLERYAYEMESVEDVYMAILWPRAIGKPLNYAIFSDPSDEYRWNAKLDVNHDGHVTKAEASAHVVEALRDGREADREARAGAEDLDELPPRPTETLPTNESFFFNHRPKISLLW